MKHFFLFITAALLFACGNQPTDANNSDTENSDIKITEKGGHYKISADASEIEWTGKHTFGDDRVGSVNIKEGTINVEKQKLTGGSFVLDMTTIQNTSFEDEKSKKDITEHLKNKDFFDVTNHPTATFKITTVSNSDSADFTHVITGDLTLKGITNAITFPATVEINGPLFNASANFNIDRRKWNIMYNSEANFLKKLIDIPKKYVVGDYVGFSINLVAKNAD